MTVETKALVTIDTEVGETAKFVDGGFEQFVLGDVDEGQYGIPEIRRQLDQRGMSGEFFVDVYEATYYEESKYRRFCQRLDDGGHGVQLHTHPSYQYDRNRANMYEYSLDEQTDIVADGIDYIRRWLGRRPVAHRAGMYGANDDTIRALAANDVPIDSSYFHRESNCKLTAETVNHPLTIHGVREIPVTSMHPFARKFGIPLPYRRSPLKLDVNWLHPDRMTASLDSLLGEVPFILLFLHSSSLVTRSDDGLSATGVDDQALRSFTSGLDFLVANDVDVTTFRDLQKASVVESSG